MHTLCKSSFLRLLKTNVQYVSLHAGDELLQVARLDHLKIKYHTNQQILDALNSFKKEPVYFGSSQKIQEFSLDKKA